MLTDMNTAFWQSDIFVFFVFFLFVFLLMLWYSKSYVKSWWEILMVIVHKHTRVHSKSYLYF